MSNQSNMAKRRKTVKADQVLFVKGNPDERQVICPHYSHDRAYFIR